MSGLYNCAFCNISFDWAPYSETQCYRIETTSPTAPITPISLSQQPNLVYSSLGTRFYDMNYPTNGVGNILYTSSVVDVWQSSSISNGPLNRSGIWNSSSSAPLDTWVGFSSCLNTTDETKTYYVGIGGDNQFRLVLDGVEIVNTLLGSYSASSPGYAFRYWHVYPIVISQGQHTLELYGWNNTGGFVNPADFGCEIYDNTLNELTGATSIGDINIIFSSSAFTEATIVQDSSGNYTTSGYSCPSGYVYSECDGGNCIQYIFCDSPSSCGVSEYCINNTGNPNYDGQYVDSGLYEGISYYTSLSNSYVIYYSTATNSWCLSGTLGGSCFLTGKSPCNTNCPDICDTYFFSGVCPTPTPTPTINCNSFNFESIFDCAVTPSPTVTPSITPTTSITPSPSSTVFCPVGINASISAYTPTPTVTPTITP